MSVTINSVPEGDSLRETEMCRPHMASLALNGLATSQRSAVTRSGLALMLVAIFLGGGQAPAQGPDSWLDFHLSHRRDNGGMMSLVRPLTETVGDSVVQVLSGGKPVALGTVVSEDGYLLTKRSEMSGDPLRVRTSEGRLLPARVAAVRRSNDLALLHVDSKESLQPISFESETPDIGGFLLSSGRGGRPIGLGVVGVGPRRIAHTGRLGVMLSPRNTDGGALVGGILPGSGADRAGLELGDRIIAINGRKQMDRSAVMDTLHGMYPGEVVHLTIEREGSKLDLDARMRDLAVLQESENDAKVNGPRSQRLSGFDAAIHHDTVLDPEQCGGPVLNSSGRVVGINIARAGRVVSYALPSSVVLPQMLEMLEEARATEQ